MLFFKQLPLCSPLMEDMMSQHPCTVKGGLSVTWAQQLWGEHLVIGSTDGGSPHRQEDQGDPHTAAAVDLCRLAVGRHTAPGVGLEAWRQPRWPRSACVAQGLPPHLVP